MRLLEHAVRETEALKIFFRYALWLVWLGKASLLAGRMGDTLTFAKSAVEHAHAHGVIHRDNLACRERNPREARQGL